MIFYARTEKDAMAVIIDNGAKKAEQVNPVGKMLMEFIYLSAKEVNDAFDMLFTELQRPGDLDGCGLADLIEQYCGGNLYLMYFVESLAEVLINGKISTKAGFERLCAAYASEEAILRNETQFKDVTWQTATKTFVIGLFSLRTLALQSFALEQLEFCMDSTENKLYKGLSASQRLYLYEQWRMANGEQPL